MAMPIERKRNKRVPTVDASTAHGTSTALLADLDRCTHGRHHGDPCADCGGYSSGNLYIKEGDRLGTGKAGEALVVPHRVYLPDAKEWRREGYVDPPVPEHIRKVNEQRQRAAEGLKMVSRVIELFGGREDVPFSQEFMAIVGEIYDERLRQFAKFGDQSHFPDGTSEKHREISDKKRTANKQAFRDGRPTFAKILTEEFFEVMAEENEELLYQELTQVVAVGVQWMEAIRKRRDQAHAEVELGIPRIGQ